MMDGAQQSGFDLVTIRADFIQHFAGAKEDCISPDIIVDGKKQLGLPERLAPVDIAVGEVFQYSGIVRLAGLGGAQVTKAVCKFPPSNHVHRLQIISELFVRIPDFLAGCRIH